MVDITGSVSDLLGPMVRILTGHVVSSTSMVSRAYLSDPALGVVVDGGSQGLWLAATLDALVPDPDELRRRAAESGGPPVEYGSPRLVKVTVSWGGVPVPTEPDDEVSLANPQLAMHPGGARVAAISLDKPASFAAKVADGTGPKPLSVQTMVAKARDVGRALGEPVAVVVPVASGGSLWPMIRWARVSSDPDGGFAEEPGSVALDISLDVEHSGSPAYCFDNGKPRFCGLVSPLTADVSVLVKAVAIAETIGSS